MHGAEDLYWVVAAAYWLPRVLVGLVIAGVACLAWRWCTRK